VITTTTLVALNSKMEFVQAALRRFGYLFYLVDPWRESYETMAEIPNYVAEVVPWFFTFVMVERFFLYKKRGHSPPLNDTLTSVAAGIFMEVKYLVFRGSSTALYIYLYENYCVYRMPWDSIYTWLVCALLYDLCYYLGHRGAHEINLFWTQHQVHHSSEEYNLSTALRQGAFQSWATMFFFLPLALFIPPTQFIVHGQLNLLYQFWIHTELIDDLGPLEWILNTPSHHRVHHGSARYCIDKNYAGVLIVWDRLFGTFAAERRDQPMVYGLVDQVESFNPFYLQVFYLGKVFQKAWATPGLFNKLRCLFYGPGWFPGTPRLGNYEDLPETIDRKKFGRLMTMRMQLYSAVHFTLLSVGHQILTAKRYQLELGVFYLCCVYLLVSLTSLGLLYNGSRFFPWLECGRCLLFLAVSPHLALEQPLAALLWLVRLFYFYSAVTWASKCVASVGVSQPEKTKMK